MDTSPRVDSNIECGNYVVDADTWTSPNVTQRVTSVGQLNETFSINAQLCVPAKDATKKHVLQVVTHGVGFDMRHVLDFLSCNSTSSIWLTLIFRLQILGS